MEYPELINDKWDEYRYRVKFELPMSGLQWTRIAKTSTKSKLWKTSFSLLRNILLNFCKLVVEVETHGEPLKKFS